MKLVVGREYSVGGSFRTLKCEIAVKFDHGVAGLDGVVGVDLDFVVVLGVRERNQNDQAQVGARKSGAEKVSRQIRAACSPICPAHTESEYWMFRNLQNGVA
jgi:hypothetical protein